MKTVWDFATSGLAALVVTVMCAFFAFVLALGLIAAVVRGLGAAGGAFAKGWREKGEELRQDQR